MKAGGGHAKGADFERKVCKALSLWVTMGKRDDVFWRSAMSGGRATIRFNRGIEGRVQLGDITAIDAAGTKLTDCVVIECKHVKELNTGRFLFLNSGPLFNHWKQAVRQAQMYKREPMLIARENGRMPTLLITTVPVINTFGLAKFVRVIAGDVHVCLFDEAMRRRR